MYLAQSKVEEIIKHRIVGALLRYVRLYELVFWSERIYRGRENVW
jgi:hypothetical protein